MQYRTIYRKSPSNAGSFLIALAVLTIIAGCSSTESPSADSAISPEWIERPPLEEGFIFGIGVDADPSRARRKALVNVGQQFVSRISSSVETSRVVSGAYERSLVRTIEHQLTETEVVGAKFADQFIDTDGRIWILSRAPLNCVLDVTEGILLSYTLKNEHVETLHGRIETVMRAVESSLATAETAYFEALAEGIVAVAPGSISVDGTVSDWSAAPLAIDEESDQPIGARDITRIYLASDGEFLYLRADFREGRPSATGSDITYDLTFTLGADHYELWCLKAGMNTAVNVGKRTAGGGAIWRDTSRECRARTGDGTLEARFPWSSIEIDPGAPQQIYAKFRIRDGGDSFDELLLPPIEM